jgi:hypothetical protein
VVGRPKTRARREAAARAAEEAALRGEIIPPKPSRGPELPRPPKPPGNNKRSPELEAEILKRLSEGESLRAICRDAHIPARDHVANWCVVDPEGFGAQYSKARELGAHQMADEVLEIADNSKRDLIEKTDENGNTVYVADREVLERSRIKIDARKWYLDKLFPKQFGDRVTHDGAVNMSLDKMFQEIDGTGDRIPITGKTEA